LWQDSVPGLESAFGMMWRFAPMADDNVDEWHSRDLVSILRNSVSAENFSDKFLLSFNG
jgi:hypothetical protein